MKTHRPDPDHGQSETPPAAAHSVSTGALAETLNAPKGRTAAAAPPATDQLGEELPVLSPCVSVCRMDEASGLCEGCWRTLGEIAGWASMDNPQRKAIWERIEQRMGDSL